MARSLAQIARRIGLADTASPYERFIAKVEPELLAQPRVHRFAEIPVRGRPGMQPEPLAVCIHPVHGGDVGATRASLERQTVGPAAVLETPLEQALADTRAGWIAWVRAGDVLAPRALERLGQAVALAPGAAIVTCDDDRLEQDGRRSAPRLRPGPSPDLWRAHDPALALMALAREPASGAVRGAPATPYRLLLALGGPDGAGQAHVPLVLCHRRAPVEKEAAPAPRHSPPREPAVEAIVPFRDRSALLERCVRSVLEGSSYERLSLRLVDNGSSESDTAELLDRLAGHARVTVERDPRRFNFSALGNAAAARSSADVLVFLNNDTEVVTADWVERLVDQALRSEVGAVGPLLTFPDGRVQHAGAALGLHGWAGHPFACLGPDEQTPFGKATDGPRNWLAVSAACLMVERAKFNAVGGFDESFAVGGGDVDLCLRLTAAGHRSLCVPQVRLIHDESASRDPTDIPAGDFEASRRSYGEFRTVGDPFYHPALSLEDTSCRVRTA